MIEPQKSSRQPQAAYKHRDYSYIWLVPLLALVVVGWMGWSSYHSDGPVIHITFAKGDGIEINRTQIKHKGVVLGVVRSLAPNEDFSRVVLTAHMGSIAAPYLNKGSQFWIVRPRVSVGSISDLNTLVSGSYIELSPGEGDRSHDFNGLEEPVAVDQHEPGKSFVLHSPEMGSIERGSPLYFRGLQVGEVTNFELSPDKDVLINIFIRAPYDKLVLDQTHFWDASGIGITAGPEGIRIAAQSLQSVVQGGITFDVPDHADGGAPAEANARYELYTNRDAASDSVFTKTIAYRLRFSGSIQGLDTGSPVNLMGNRIGHVSETKVIIDDKAGTTIAQVLIAIQTERLHFDESKPSDTDVNQRARAAFKQMVKHNMRAQVVSANLLTGQKAINLDFINDVSAGAISGDESLPDFPTTTANDIDSLIKEAHGVLNDTDKTLQDTDKTIRSVGPAIEPLLTSLKTTTDQINSNDGHGGLSGTLYELKQAAQSVKALADYLDAHPEAIVRGKQ